jgi:hypothetical protein
MWWVILVGAVTLPIVLLVLARLDERRIRRDWEELLTARCDETHRRLDDHLRAESDRADRLCDLLWQWAEKREQWREPGDDYAWRLCVGVTIALLLAVLYAWASA